MSAVVASAVSAEPALFTANVSNHSEKAKIHGGQTGTDILGIGIRTLTCATATVQGEAETAGTSSAAVVLTPTYHTCHFVFPFIGTRTTTVTMNGCTYTFNATRNTGSNASGPTPGINTSFSADLHINCPEPSKPIEIHIYNTANHNDAGAETLCTFNIPPQTALDQIELTNTVTHEILAHIHANIVLTNATPHGICKTNHFLNAIYKGSDTLTATNAAGENVGSTVS